MAYELPIGQFTFLASTGLKQYQFVEINSAGVLINPTTSGRCIGVLVSSGTTGSTGRAGSTTSGTFQSVQFYGIAKVLAGTTTVATADVVTSATDGRCITATTNFACGRALGDVTSTSTSSECIPVLLFNTLAQTN